MEKCPLVFKQKVGHFLTHHVLHSEIFGPDDDALRL